MLARKLKLTKKMECCPSVTREIELGGLAACSQRVLGNLDMGDYFTSLSHKFIQHKMNKKH